MVQFLFVVACFAVMGVMAVGILRAVQWVGRAAFPPKPAPPAPKLNELANDWSAYGRHLRRKVPNALRQMYERDEDVGFFRFKRGEHDISMTFESVGGDVIDSRDEIGFDVMPFATSDSGDPIYLLPGPKVDNSVYMIVHDSGEPPIVLCEDIEEFLGSLRIEG